MIRVAPLADAAEAAPVLRILRQGLDDALFAERLRRAVAQGYRVLGAHEETALSGVLGYRVTDDLFWGRTLFVDDLVVVPARRGAGIGARLLGAAKGIAKQSSCDHLRLCSGLDRGAAHRFYETNGLTRRSLQFVTDLSE